MKLPQNAEKKFNGIIFDVYQWQQEMYDGSFETFEMLKRPDTLQVIPVLDNGNIIVAYEHQPGKPPGWTILGGRQEEGEAPEDVIKREFLEETGMTADIWELQQSFMPYSKMDWTIYRYTARGIKKVQEPKLDAGEKIELKEVDWDEFIDIATSREFWCKGFSLELLYRQKEGTLDQLKQQILGT